MLATYSSATFITSGGLAVGANASIEVRAEDSGSLAALFSDEAGTVPLANPFNADSQGFFVFYVAGRDRGYQVKSTKDAEVRTLRNQAIGTAAQLDASTVGKGVIQAVDAAAGRDALELDSHDIYLNSLFGTP